MGRDNQGDGVAVDQRDSVVGLASRIGSGSGQLRHCLYRHCLEDSRSGGCGSESVGSESYSDSSCD